MAFQSLIALFPPWEYEGNLFCRLRVFKSKLANILNTVSGHGPGSSPTVWKIPAAKTETTWRYRYEHRH